MKRSSVLTVIFFVLLMVAISISCGGDGDEAIHAPSIEVVGQGDQIQLAFDEGSEEYLIFPYWTATEEATAEYSLTAAEGQAESVDEGAEEGSGEPSARRRFHRGLAAQKPGWISQRTHRRILKRHAWSVKLRNFEREIYKDASIRSEDLMHHGPRARIVDDCGENEVKRGDECVGEFDLKFMDFSMNLHDLSVAVKGIGEHCYVVVDTDDEVAQADIDAIIERFDSHIYPRDHFLYGDTVFEGTDYADRDGDGIHMIAFSHLVAEADVAGLFNLFDFYPATAGNATGNVADILWIELPSAESPLGSVFGTVAHEYFHLMIFAVKAIKNKQPEEAFLNENMAHLAEDSSGFGIDNITIVASYLDNAADYTWAFSDVDDVETRAMGYMFLRYLFEQQGGVEYSSDDAADMTDNGGAAFLRKIMQTQKTGFEAVDEALGSGGWKDHFFNWMVAVTASGTDITNDPKYKYEDLYEDPLTGQKIGLCTHCTRKTADGTDVEMAGFASEDFEDPYEGAITATGLNVIKVTGEGNLFIDTEADEDIKFGILKIK